MHGKRHAESHADERNRGRARPPLRRPGRALRVFVWVFAAASMMGSAGASGPVDNDRGDDLCEECPPEEELDCPVEPSCNQPFDEFVFLVFCCKCCQVVPLTQDCFLSPGEFLAAYDEWHEKQIDPECNSDHDEPLTPCELAQEYIDLVEDYLGAPLSDEEKCRIRVAFRCPDDCGGGGGDFYPPWDPINPIGPPWVSVSNPFPGPATTPPSIGSVDLARGAYRPREVDLSLPSPGFSWVIGRGYAVDPDNPQSPVDSYQGYNWAQISHPMITEPETITSGVFIGLRTVTILYERIGRMGFIESSAGSGIFIGTEGTRGVVVEIPADGDDPEMYELYTQNGTITTFFGYDVNAAGAEGQLWKHVDVAGNTAWVGHPDEADTAVTNGYADGRMLYAVDPGDRRYVYTYSGSEIGGLKRLIEVEAQTKTGGAWEGTPSGVSEVARVEYGFYEEDEENFGLEGDLKLVTVVMPTSVSGVSTQTQRYYRYYAGASRALSDLPDFIKMVVGSEGLRRVGSVFETESDGDLKPYAEMFFVYSLSDGRIESFFQNGDCGCAGGSGVDGTIELSYDENPAFEEEDGFQDEWRYRTVVAFPDGLYVTHYVDELFKPWAEVRTDDDPAETAPVPSAWVTRFVRDPDTAETVKIVTPSAVSSYTHNDGSNDPLGTIVTSTTDGLVRLFEYSLEDDIFGHLIHTKWRQSDHAEADAFLLSTTRYDARVLEVATDDNGQDLDDYTATVARSFVAESWVYTVAGTDVSVIGDPADGSYLTQFDYEAFSTTRRRNPTSSRRRSSRRSTPRSAPARTAPARRRRRAGSCWPTVGCSSPRASRASSGTRRTTAQAACRSRSWPMPTPRSATQEKSSRA